MNTGLALLVSARVVTQKSLKAFRAIEKYEKDSIPLFINQAFATYFRHKGQEII